MSDPIEQEQGRSVDGGPHTQGYPESLGGGVPRRSGSAPTPMSDAEEQRKVMQETGPYMTLGIQLALTMVLFYVVGAWIDRQNGGGALWTAVLTGFGAVAGVIYFILTVTQLGKQEEERARARKIKAAALSEGSALNHGSIRGTGGPDPKGENAQP